MTRWAVITKQDGSQHPPCIITPDIDACITLAENLMGSVGEHGGLNDAACHCKTFDTQQAARRWAEEQELAVM